MFPGHPYAVAMETVHLAPNAQVSLYPWKDTPDKIPLAVRHIPTLLRAHRPVAAARSTAAAAQYRPITSFPASPAGAARWPSCLASGNDGNGGNKGPSPVILIGKVARFSIAICRRW
jgi:hypothetical protein